MNRVTVLCLFSGPWEAPKEEPIQQIYFVDPSHPEELFRLLREIPQDLLIIQSPQVRLFPHALVRFTETPGALVFSDYEEDGHHRALVEDIGDITERFKLGPVFLLRRKALEAVGGIRPYRYAWLYDVRLRFQEQDLPVVHIPEPLYRVTRKEDPHQRYTFSDSFEYLFYGKAAEREYERVFKEMLRRRGALLDGTYDPLPDPQTYPVTVSVVIPVRNRQDFIGEALESVLRQTFQDFEVVVVDASSTDQTPEIVRQFQRKDPRVRLVTKPPGNIAEAINVGIRNARGKYIAQLDSDDFYEPDTLEHMVQAMERNPDAGLAISYYRIVDPQGRPVPLDPVTHLEFDRNNILRVDGAGALRFFRKRVFEILGPFSEQAFGDYGEDYDMVLRISEHFRVIRVHKVLYNYRRHPGSTDAMREYRLKALQKTRIRLLALARRQMLNRTRQMASGLPAP